ncbi:hypothetical protein H0H81_012545 [Sphagnurus paluster]|uniref:Phospholipase D/nuclease n=1 Tax=Sphagnurus paluster TaxID=117069 RepID=A0A9P7KH84_9AGAR|nr:hypothetical protein H0H81_012545 [Sphagnurus paluster]
MDYQNDDDLARAIALSLQDVERKPDVIDLVDDPEEQDEDALFQLQLEQAIEASKAESSTQPAEPRPGVRTNSKSSPLDLQTRTQPNAHVAQSESRPPQAEGSGVSSFLSERAQMEKERRERQKRLRPDSGFDTSLRGGEDDEGSGLKEPPAKRQHISSSHGVRTNNGKSHPFASHSQTSRSISQNAPANVPMIDQVFWNGELRPTATVHAEPRQDRRSTFRLTEILGKVLEAFLKFSLTTNCLVKKSELEFAIMSSYALDFAWIYEFFDRSVPVIMVAQPDATGQATLKNVLPNWIRTTPALRGGRGCMHMKFMLLFYKTGRLRVVISTANLIAYDYRDMENMVWLQDIPLRSKPIPHDPRAPQDFPTVFQGVLHALHVPPALRVMINDNHPNLPLKSIEELRMRWDWSNVTVHLVPSIAGRHEGWPNVIKAGHPRLMNAVRNMGMRTGKGRGSKNILIECQGSSLGNYTTQWLNEFHWSARGETAEDWLDESKKKRERLPFPPVKIVFPTKATVHQSRLGEQMIIATYKEVSKGEQGSGSDTADDSDDEIELIEPAVGWAYVGSHNFTPSAWGTLSGSGFNPILNARIVFPLKNKDYVDSIACFERPPRKYTQTDEPWIQEESIYHQAT